MSRARLLFGLCVLGCVGAVCAGTVKLGERMGPGASVRVERGRYLVAAGDCVACHTAKNGKPFAGGRPVPTPFGVIYSTNITPDPDTGIGRWNNDDFYRAMHEGIDRQGKHLYPAFPYPWYTRISRDDVLSIKAYLDTLTPVRQRAPANELPWPMSVRGAIAVWNGLYFDDGTFQADPDKSAQWNRGAYLVRGLGHCSACHGPKNFAGATDNDHPLSGGHAEHAYAPDLGGDKRDGLGDWSEQEIVDYLATGRNDRTAAAGPMAEVVEQSTQHLTSSDLHAIAVYLKSQPAGDGEDDEAHHDVDKGVLTAGASVYVDNCMGCHLQDGSGQRGAFPPLRDSAPIRAQSADTLINVILQGSAIPSTPREPTGLRMQGFADHLSDTEIANVATYIRNTWGNHASAVSPGAVHDMRENLRSMPP